MTASVYCPARGSGSIDEGIAKLDDSTVQFMLVKFPVGSGTFKRNKFVYVHCIGPNCGMVKRGKLNAQADAVLKRLNTATGFAFNEGRASLSFDFIVNKLQKAFVADDGTFDVSKLRDEYNKRLEEEKAKMAKDVDNENGGEGGADPMSPGSPGSPLRVRKLATDLNATLPMILKALGEDMGPFNWVTVTPGKTPEAEPVLEQAGSNGIFELIENLPADKILFGVVRVGFGTGRFRRTKRIFFQWNGDSIGAVAKGKANVVRDGLVNKLLPCHATITINGSEEANVPCLLAKMEKLFVVDHIEMQSTQEKPKPLSAEEYVQALAEEQRANSSFYNEPEEYQSPPASPNRERRYDVDETIKLIHQEEGGLSWAIFQPEA